MVSAHSDGRERWAALAELTHPVGRADPQKAPGTTFSYIDISAIDSETKSVVRPQRVLGIDAPSRARQSVRAGDILVSTVRPNLNAVALLDESHDGAVASTGFCVLRPDPEVLDANYAFQWVRTAQFVGELMHHATGASYPAVTDKVVKRSAIRLPPIEEQRRIAALLDAADELRTKRHLALAKLDTLTQAIFIDMFGDLGYERAALGDLLQRPLRNGISPAKSGKHVASVLTLSAITGGRFNGAAVKESTFRTAHSRENLVSAGDFLICRGNGNLTLVGRGAFPTTDMPAVAFPDTMIAARFDRGRIAPGYLGHVWQLRVVREQIERSARTTNGTYKINQQMIEAIELPLPPVAEQEEFGLRRQRVHAEADRHRESAAVLDTLFSSLQQRAFRGDL